jgi:hypothetical protein
MKLSPRRSKKPKASETLTHAIAKAQQLPDADQERIGRELSAYVDDLRNLRADLSEGLRSLDAGLGKELDIENVIARARAQHAKV